MNGHICSAGKKSRKQNHTHTHEKTQVFGWLFFFAPYFWFASYFSAVAVCRSCLFFSRSSRTHAHTNAVYRNLFSNKLRVRSVWERPKAEYLHQLAHSITIHTHGTRCRIEEKYLICVSENECCVCFFLSRHRCRLLCILNNSVARAHQM